MLLMSTPAQRLKQARHARDPKMTQEELAEACGWPYGSRIGNYEQGKNEPDIESWEIMAKALGVTVNHLLFGDDPDSKAAAVDAGDVEIPIYNARGAAGDGATNDRSIMIGSLTFKRRSLERRGLNYKDLATIYVDGDSMSPGIRDGAVVIFDKSKTTVRHGEVYVVRMDDELLVKRLHKTPEGLCLISDNSADPRYAPRNIPASHMDSFQVLGQVVWSANWF